MCLSRLVFRGESILFHVIKCECKQALLITQLFCCCYCFTSAMHYCVSDGVMCHSFQFVRSSFLIHRFYSNIFVHYFLFIIEIQKKKTKKINTFARQFLKHDTSSYYYYNYNNLLQTLCHSEYFVVVYVIHFIGFLINIRKWMYEFCHIQSGARIKEVNFLKLTHKYGH